MEVVGLLGGDKVGSRHKAGDAQMMGASLVVSVVSLLGRLLVHFLTTLTQNNHTETLLFKSLLGQSLKCIAS